MATVRCPTCERALEVEDAYRDWTVRCPHCDTEFVPDEVGARGERPRPRREEFEDRDDRAEDEYDRDDARESAREEALRVVAGPGTALEVIGWLGILWSLGICALCVVLAIEMNNNANVNGDDEFLILLGCCAGAVGVPYSLAMAIGGRKMRALSSRGWAMTASILGVASFSLFGVCGIVQAGIGAWALVALDKPAVRAAFGLEPRRRPNPHLRRARDD